MLCSASGYGILINLLIPNIGTCGLFIGMSFLSWIEFFEFFIEVMFILKRPQTEYIFYT